MPQDLMISHAHRTKREIRADDLDSYKTGLLTTLRNAYERLESQKRKEASKCKQYYDQRHKVVKFEVGDLVRVHYPIAEKEGLKYKLGTRWRGPYEIIGKIDAVTYRVKEEEGRRIRIIPVHVQRLKKQIEWRGGTEVSERTNSKV